MNLNNIEVGMKVKLLGKHGFGDNYDNIEDWYKNHKIWKDVQRIKERGYGVVKCILNNGEIIIRDESEKSFSYCFLPEDLEPVVEELLPIGTKIRQIKPKFGMEDVSLGIFEVVDADNTHIFATHEQGIWIYCSITKQELEEYWEVVEEKKDKWEDVWHYHECGQYKVHSNGKKVKFKIASGDVGVAICCDDDEFDLKKGIEIAKKRATIKYLEKQIKKLSK